MDKNRTSGYKGWVGTILLIFVLFFFINYFTPAIADDFNCIDHYKFNSNEKIQTLGDLFESMKVFYVSWGGRIMGHALMVIAHFLPPVVFDLLNTAAYLLLSLLIYKICNMGKEKNILLYLFLHMALWFFVPDYGQVMFWTSGAVNYLWPSLFCLFSLYLYRSYAAKKGEALQSGFLAIPLFLLGVLSGCAMENISAGMLVIMTLYLCYFVKQKLKLRIPLLALYAGSLIGFCVLYFAPGNAARASTDQQSLGTIFKLFIVGYYWVFFGLFFAGICAIILYASKKGACKIEDGEKFSSIAIAVCSVFFIVSLADTMICSYEISVQTKQRERYISEQAAEGKQDIVVPMITHKYPFRAKHDALEGLSDITEDKNFWINVSMAKHYGVESITGTAK